MPSYDMHGFGFPPVRYWREPVWINVDWFLAHGLGGHGYGKQAGRFRRTIVDLCRSEGFREHYDPTTGAGTARICSRGWRPCSSTCSWKRKESLQSRRTR